MNRVVNLRVERPPGVVVVDQTSKYGNPFHRLKLPRATSVALYRVYLRWVLTWIDSDFLEPLRGKVLGCWCVPADCHATAIAEELDRRSPDAR